MKANCVIIEDEAVAARRLAKLIEKNQIDVRAILHSIQEAKEWFEHNQDPDIIFLDIQLGDGISFEIFEDIEVKSAIIFTTAYERYALRAFKLNSIDYLLKPINDHELSNAINKFLNRSQTQVNLNPLLVQQILQSNFENKYRERFLIKVGSKFKTIETKDISMFYSEDSATYMCVSHQRYIVEHSLDELQDQLDPKQLYRISRRAIVHLPYIEDIISHSGSRLLLKMIGSKENWVVSRERVRDFKLWLAK